MLPTTSISPTGFAQVIPGDFIFYLDQLSLVMLLVVTGVGFLIHIYSVGYMGTTTFTTASCLLEPVMFFMLTLCWRRNYLLMFHRWEGVGLASYLFDRILVYERFAAAAGKKAFIVIRFGDFGFLICRFSSSFSISDLWTSPRSLSSQFVARGERWNWTADFDRAIADGGSSRQVCADSSLRLAAHAMEGPTPVSALIHAATMVTAGVYMVARSPRDL